MYDSIKLKHDKYQSYHDALPHLSQFMIFESLLYCINLWQYIHCEAISLDAPS